MKKFLLTLAAGMLILSLPVIASAATGFDEYSGYTASVTVRGFTLYSTAKGVQAGMRPFAHTYTAASTAKNTYGYFDTGAGNQEFVLYVQLNANTTLEIEEGYNSIAPKGSNTIHTNAYWLVYNDTGATPSDAWGDMNTAAAGLTATQVLFEGASAVVIQRNPTTGAMVMTMRNPMVDEAYTKTCTSVVDAGGDYGSAGNLAWDIYGYYITPTYINNWVVSPTSSGRAVRISPIHLTPTPGSTGSNFSPWWQ